jgi:hypothetical protein
MKFSTEEIALCIQIAAILRKPIEYGDYYILGSDDETPKIWIWNYQAPLIHPSENKPYLYIWTFQDARNWLRKKGKILIQHRERPDGNISIDFQEDDEVLQVTGKTDLEAILKVIVQILKEEK